MNEPKGTECGGSVRSRLHVPVSMKVNTLVTEIYAPETYALRALLLHIILLGNSFIQATSIVPLQVERKATNLPMSHHAPQYKYNTARRASLPGVIRQA